MYAVEIVWMGQAVRLPGEFNSRDDAHWACAKWRNSYGRPTDAGDPFRVVEAPKVETLLVTTKAPDKWDADGFYKCDGCGAIYTGWFLNEHGMAKCSDRVCKGKLNNITP